MQHPKNCLASAMAKFSEAACNMEHEVMFPSLLLDVPLEQPQGAGFSDLYQSYIMLKSIRMTVETGLIPLDGWPAKASTTDLHPEPEESPDLEVLLQSHTRGLLHVLSRLTNQARALTRKYKDMMGMAH
ncbi:thyroid hormone-inducible hepatic protein [Lissotriton helveticus]